MLIYSIIIIKIKSRTQLRIPLCFSLTSGCIVLSAISFFFFVLKRSTKLTTVPRIVLQIDATLWNRMCMSFQSSPFYFQSLVLNLSTLLSSIISLLCFVGVPFLEIFSPSLYVTLIFLKIRLFLSIKRRAVRIIFVPYPIHFAVLKTVWSIDCRWFLSRKGKLGVIGDLLVTLVLIKQGFFCFFYIIKMKDK
jgi:hypothetical protein